MPATYVATHHRMGARWHLRYSLVDEKSAKIERIWRDDDAPNSPLSWKALEEGADRIVVGVMVGNPDLTKPGLRPPLFNGANNYRVTNPQHIFSYDFSNS